MALADLECFSRTVLGGVLLRRAGPAKVSAPGWPTPFSLGGVFIIG
eukprot:CAMPEP_0174906182 /NCGR_PEP_ID=MMETSP0167-20121228/55995_1 /TAXON_ID=38298 /ORGANISM="Rhodella maculata, Strain CCMP736" /LENGTH=45 /DNA_ID= /DNA_START= /DNA_END= /DNA_ORIENTATION=